MTSFLTSFLTSFFTSFLASLLTGVSDFDFDLLAFFELFSADVSLLSYFSHFLLRKGEFEHLQLLHRRTGTK